MATTKHLGMLMWHHPPPSSHWNHMPARAFTETWDGTGLCGKFRNTKNESVSLVMSPL